MECYMSVNQSAVVEQPEPQTVSICWMQRLNGETEVLETGVPIAAALPKLHEHEIALAGAAGGVCFIKPEYPEPERPITIKAEQEMEFYAAVSEQCEANDRRWGGPSHDRTHRQADWLAILDHQLAQLRYEVQFSVGVGDFHARLIKLAAVCQAAWMHCGE